MSPRTEATDPDQLRNGFSMSNTVVPVRLGRKDEGMKDLQARLEDVPQNVFWKEQVGGSPDYLGIRAHLLREDFPHGMVPIESLASWYNPSTLQRTIAREAVKRRALLRKPA